MVNNPPPSRLVQGAGFGTPAASSLPKVSPPMEQITHRAFRGEGTTSKTRRVRPGAVTVIAELAMTIGGLMFLFVVWELWWTGIDAEADRRESLESFYSQIQEEGTGVEVDTCYTLNDGTPIGCAPKMRELTGPDDIMGTLYAPRLGDDWVAPVRAGVSAYQIDRGGVGHYLTTEWPDEPGNFAVAGHRNTYSSMLGDQDLLESGDRIYLVSPDGMWIYEVYERNLVSPSDNHVLRADPAGGSPETGILTLTTCHPMFSNKERLIHHAHIVDFLPVGASAPDDLQHHQDLVTVFDGSAAQSSPQRQGT